MKNPGFQSTDTVSSDRASTSTRRIDIVMPAVVGGHPGDARVTLDARVHGNDGG